MRWHDTNSFLHWSQFKRGQGSWAGLWGGFYNQTEPDWQNELKTPRLYSQTAAMMWAHHGLLSCRENCHHHPTDNEFAWLIQLTRAWSDPATFALITLGHMTSQYMNMEFNAQDFKVSGQLQTIESPPPRVSVRADAVCRFNLNPVGRASCGQDGTARVKTGPWRRKFRQSENEYYYLTVTGHQVSAGEILWMTSRSHEFI